MPLEINYNCPECGITMEWVCSDGELEPSGMIGCPGQNCTRIHKLRVTQIDQERADQIESKYS